MDIPNTPEQLADAVYEPDANPLLWSEYLVATAISVHLGVIIARHQDPAACPEYPVTLNNDALARSILGELLASGWVAPTEPIPVEERP